MRIGNVEIAPPLVLAPMAGTTNHAFRILCKHHGAGAVWTEMISAYGIRSRNPKTMRMFDWTEEERPVVVQLFGGESRILEEAARAVEHAGADIIDVNMGCPVRKVAKSGAGAALMQDMDRAAEIMEAVVKAVNIPVTIKTRSGPTARRLTAVEMARLAEQAGISAVIIHGRTAAQGFSGQAEWRTIRQVKAAVGIPIIGNGDVRSPEDAKRMFEETGCDGVMIGRAALGNPWIFSRTANFLKSGDAGGEPSATERIATAREHFRRMVELLGEERAVREMRGQLGWYVKGMEGAVFARQCAGQATTAREIEELLDELLIEQRQSRKS